MNIGAGLITCPCGWETPFTPPLVMDGPNMGIDGSASRPFINCHDSAGKLIRHSHEAKP